MADDQQLQEIKDRLNAIEERLDDFEVMLDDNCNSAPGHDLLIGEAARLILKWGKASSAVLQRGLSIGYARAARLMEELENLGFISEANGAEPRKIYREKLEECINVPDLDKMVPDDDPLLLKASELIKDRETIDANWLQRKLNMGFTNVYYLVRKLEKQGRLKESQAYPGVFSVIV